MKRDEPRGQILVVVAAGMMTLLIICALVVDLGFSWMLRRQEQNAADPGAIAAAKWLRDPITGDAVDPLSVMAQMEAEACFYAQSNGFFADDPDCGFALDEDQLRVESPPISGPFSGFAGYVQVIISESHPAFFSRIINRDSLEVTTAAVAANNVEGSYTSSLHALDPTGCHAGQVQGNGGPSTGAKVSIVPRVDPETGLPFTGGFVQVNSDCDGPVTPATLANCPSGDGALKVAGSSSLDAPAIYTYGDCARDGGATITTDASNKVYQGALPVGDPLAQLRGPRFDATDPGASCGVGGATLNATVNNQGCATGGSTKWEWTPCADDNTIRCVELHPGIYYGGWQLSTNKYRLLLNPGLYIIAGGGIRQTGSAIQAVSGDGDPSTAQVMIFNADNPAYEDQCAANYSAYSTTYPERCQGPIDFTAGSSFRAYGIGDYACSLDPTVCPFRGILLWHDWRGSCPTLECDVSLGGGTAALSIGGTVYAANQLVDLAGSGDVSGDVAAIQIISYRWKITGNSQIQMPYDPRDFYQLVQRGLVD